MRGLLQKAVFCIFAGVLVTPAFAQFGAPTRPQVPLPEGPLRNVILKNCVSCHGIDDYAFFAFSRERWEELLEEKHKGLKVNELSRNDHDLLLDYLSEAFGPETNPFPRQHIPPEITTFFNDEQGRQVLDIVCTECHELDRVYEARHTLARWRVLVLEMRQRGANIPDDVEMEQLTEWLSRVQSANTFE